MCSKNKKIFIYLVLFFKNIVIEIKVANHRRYFKFNSGRTLLMKTKREDIRNMQLLPTLIMVRQPLLMSC